MKSYSDEIPQKESIEQIANDIACITRFVIGLNEHIKYITTVNKILAAITVITIGALLATIAYLNV